MSTHVITFLLLKRRWLNISLSVTLLLSVIVGNANAQREIPFGEEPYQPCDTRHFTALTDAPPYSTDMPLEVILAYMAIDSLSKANIEYEDMYQTLSDSLSVDDIKELLKYFYAAMDYDPLLFMSYIKHGYYINEQYINSPRAYYYYGRKVAFKKLGGHTLLYMLSFSSGIYEVELTDVYIDSSYQRNSGNTLDVETCIRAKVLDIIKGNNLPYMCSDEEGGTVNPLGCIDYSYTNRHLTMRQSGDSNDFISIGVFIDSTGERRIMSPLYGVVHNPHVGERYLVFLDVQVSILVDSLGALYSLHPYVYAQIEGGLFKIEGGVVNDSTDYFGLGTSVSISTLKEYLRSYINDNLR